MKKGFTLIELLGVVILLAVISLIATPIILNVIKEAQESANMSSAYLIESSGHNYYATSLLDESKQEKIDNYENIYEELDIQNKPEFGQLYVNSNDKVAMAVIINDKCYKKDYMTEIEVVDVSECDLGYMGPDEVKPTISQTASNTNINENGWYKEDIYLTINVEDNESGVFGYKRCISQSECEPEDTIYTNESILINIESASNYVCVIGVDKRGNESDKNCEIYKLDKTLPIIEGIGDKTININEPIDLNAGVTYDDSLSGIDDELIIEPATIDTSTIGTKQVTYKVQDLAGNVREVVRNIIVDADAPSIVFSLVDSNSINENGWAKNDFYIRATITDNSGSGIQLGSSCTVNSSSECTPSATFTGTTKDFLITTEGSNRACVEVTDNNNKTTKVCSDTYNLDKTAPTLTPKVSSIEIEEGESHIVSDYFDVSYSISGGILTCTPTNTNSLTSSGTISCTATGNNGLSTTKNIQVVVKSSNLITIMSSVNGYDGEVRNTSLPRLYYVRSDGTVVRYQEFRLLSSLKDAEDGFQVMSGITNVKAVAAYSLQELFTLNNDGTISHYFCPYNSTTCTKEADITEFGNDVVQLSGDNYTETEIRNSTMPRIYALKSDGTVMRYQEFRFLSSLDDAEDGFQVMSGINNVKQIAAYHAEQIFTINNDNTVSLYRCPYNSTTCTKEQDMTEFGTDVIQLSNQNGEDLNFRDYTLPRLYALKSDGTVMRYQEFRFLSSLDDAEDGYKLMSGITNAKYIVGFGLERVIVIKNDNTLWDYKCLYNSTTCTGTQITDYIK